MPVLSRTLPFAATPQHPPFVDVGELVQSASPLRAPLAVAHGAPGEVTLRTRISVSSGAQKLLVSWQVASDPCFRQLERYGLLFVERPERDELTIILRALEPGRPYWARLWAGGSWSAATHLRTRSHERAKRWSHGGALHGEPTRFAPLVSLRETAHALGD